MTAAIKRMLAERAKLEQEEIAAKAAQAKSDLRWSRIQQALFIRIDRAAPYIDEGCEPGKWPPSKLLKILFCVGVTGRREESGQQAAEAVLALLDVARRRFMDGLHPNPFLERKEGERAHSA